MPHRRHIVVFAMEHEHHRKECEKDPPKHAKALTPSHEEMPKAANPHHKQDRVKDQDLLPNELQRRQNDILAGHPQVMKILDRGEMMPNLPDQVG